MELPAIKIPQIELPFDVPLFMHPPVDHFIIAIPVIVLLLEMINIIVKKRTIGVLSFFLLILTVVAAVVAYLTGNVDGKEAFPLLSEVAQGELKEHKILGTYLMLASVLVLAFKLLSVIISRGLMKALYLLILILFVAGILRQGKEGGELVYKYGANVQKVQKLDSELFDAKEEIEELNEELSEANKPAKVEKVEVVAPVEIKEESKAIVPEVKEVATEAPEEKVKTVVEEVAVAETVAEVKEVVTEAPEEKVETVVQEEVVVETVKEVVVEKLIPEAKEDTAPKVEVVETEVKQEPVEVSMEAIEVKEEVVSKSQVEAETAVESATTQVEESVEAAKEEIKEEVSSQAVQAVEIATH